MLELAFDQALEIINKEPLVLLYLSMPECSVCHGVKPQIEDRLAKKIPMLHLDGGEYPEIAGEFLVMTAPAVLVFYQGKEVHRQARFIDFEALERIIDNYRTMDSAKSYEDIFK